MQNVCPNCQKPASLCVCHAITQVPTKTEVLILQHPQEPDKTLGSARIAHLALSNSKLKIGLSWANLDRALDRKVDRNDWAVLYMGSVKEPKVKNISEDQLFLVAKNKELKPFSDSSPIKGIIALDGTWSQAKSLWWRNAWLSKITRIVCIPHQPSLYGRFRREPRREGLATIEALALVLSRLENNPSLKEQILTPFRELLKAYSYGRISQK